MMPLPDSFLVAVADFDTFWKLYPRKIAKQASRQVWQRAVKAVPPEKIIGALRKQLEAGMFDKEPQYIPHPRTWLCQGRWEDEVPTPSPSRSPCSLGGNGTDISVWVGKVKSRSKFAIDYVSRNFRDEARAAYRQGILDDADMHILGL